MADTSDTEHFIECDTAKDAIRLLHAGRVRGIFWLGGTSNYDYAARNIALAGGRQSDFAIVRTCHPEDQ